MPRTIAAVSLLCFIAAGTAGASVITFGTEDCLTKGCYGTNDPTAGATLAGLTAGTVTLASQSFPHGFPFTPGAGDFPGTDQIYVGSAATGADDGYANSGAEIAGPDVLTLDYSMIVPAGQTVASLTLGIAADDFQDPDFGDTFTATLNGTVNSALSAELNLLNESGPVVQFFTVGLDPATDPSNHTITLSIDEGGNGGDGYAIDFLTVGVTTASISTVPEPSTLPLAGVALVATLLLRIHPRRAA